MFKRLIAISALFSAALLSGCASVPMATPEQDQEAKSFKVAEGKANIYVYRNESMGAAIKMPVALNGKLVGDTAADTYILLTVEPGKHELVSKTENDSVLQIDAKANQNYFVWQEVKMGMWAAGSKLHLVDEAKGKDGVAECKLIQPVK